MESTQTTDLDALLTRAGKIKLLTAEQERCLGRRVRAGSRCARDRMVEANVRLVVSIAAKYARSSNRDIEDVVQAGQIGLIHAVAKFDPERGNKFSTYATWWIRQAVHRYCEEDRTIRVPEAELRRVTGAEASLARRLGRTPSDEEIADLLVDRTAADVARVRQLRDCPLLSTDAPVRASDGDTTFGELLPDEHAVDPLAHAERASLRDKVAQIVRSLPRRDAQVVRLRYGLDDARARTIREVSSTLGIDGGEVREIESRALDALRVQMA